MLVSAPASPMADVTLDFTHGRVWGSRTQNFAGVEMGLST